MLPDNKNIYGTCFNGTRLVFMRETPGSSLNDHKKENVPTIYKKNGRYINI